MPRALVPTRDAERCACVKIFISLGARDKLPCRLVYLRVGLERNIMYPTVACHVHVKLLYRDGRKARWPRLAETMHFKEDAV